MEVKKITRTRVPKSYYLCNFGEKDWEYIYQVSFDNGFKYYFAKNTEYDDKDVNEKKEILDMIESDYQLLTNSKKYNSSSNGSSWMQDYFYKELDTYLEYDNAKKIYDYLNSNKKEIKEILNCKSLKHNKYFS